MRAPSGRGRVSGVLPALTSFGFGCSAELTGVSFDDLALPPSSRAGLPPRSEALGMPVQRAGCKPVPPPLDRRSPHRSVTRQRHAPSGVMLGQAQRIPRIWVVTALQFHRPSLSFRRRASPAKDAPHLHPHIPTNVRIQERSCRARKVEAASRDKVCPLPWILTFVGMSGCCDGRIPTYPPNLHTRIFDGLQQFQQLASKTALKIVLSILHLGFGGILRSSILQEGSRARCSTARGRCRRA